MNEDRLIIWSDEILGLLEGDNQKKKVWVEIENKTYPIIGLEDSQNVGWWEIRFIDSCSNTISVEYLLANLPRGEMIMLQEGSHRGKSYPINSVYPTKGGFILKCDNGESEYWEELENWHKNTQK